MPSSSRQHGKTILPLVGAIFLLSLCLYGYWRVIHHKVNDFVERRVILADPEGLQSGDAVRLGGRAIGEVRSVVIDDSEEHYVVVIALRREFAGSVAPAPESTARVVQADRLIPRRSIQIINRRSDNDE